MEFIQGIKSNCSATSFLIIISPAKKKKNCLRPRAYSDCETDGLGKDNSYFKYVVEKTFCEWENHISTSEVKYRSKKTSLQLDNVLLKKYTVIYSTIRRLKPVSVYLPHYVMNYHCTANILISVEWADLYVCTETINLLPMNNIQLILVR